MGVWDALGRGVSGGVDAYLRGKERQEDEKRRIATESMEKERLGLAQFQTRTGMEQHEDQLALAEQLRAEERHGEYDPRTDPSRDIFIPMYDTLAEGVFVPLPQEKRDQMYVEQLAAWEAKQTGLTTTEFEREKELAKYRAQMQHQYSYPPAYAAEANKPEPSFFLNGEVNPLEAFDFLQGWIVRKGGDPRSNPDLLEIFLQDVALQYGRTVPGAREKAELWLLQQTPGTTTEPEPLGPPENILEQIRRAIPPAAAAATKTPWPLGFGAPPPLPTGQQLLSTGKNIVNKIGGLFTPSPSVGPSMSAPPTQAPLMAPQAQAPAMGKTYEEFAAEKIAAAPYLQNQPVALKMLYQQYLSTLRQQ